MITLDDWMMAYKDADREFDFTTLCQHWHSGQWSGFYKLQCNGRILDSNHASDVYSEACKALARIDNESPYEQHEDYEALSELRMLADTYPSEGQNEDAD